MRVVNSQSEWAKTEYDEKYNQSKRTGIGMNQAIAWRE